jgi:hypothetical protein
MANDRFIFESAINSFHYLYQDAYYLLSYAKMEGVRNTFHEVRASRSAFLLFVLGIEGLINRALDSFTPPHLRNFIIQKEEKFTTIEKWRLLAILCSDSQNDLDMGTYPWSHLNELIKIRNDYVHPKHDRMAYYEFISKNKFEHLQWNDIPSGMKLNKKDLVYGQTKIPKDPYGFKVIHLERVKKIVDDSVDSMDQILGGKFSEKNWARSDQMKLCYPPGATMNDLNGKS